MNLWLNHMSLDFFSANEDLVNLQRSVAEALQKGKSVTTRCKYILTLENQYRNLSGRTYFVLTNVFFSSKISTRYCNQRTFVLGKLFSHKNKHLIKSRPSLENHKRYFFIINQRQNTNLQNVQVALHLRCMNRQNLCNQNDVLVYA